MPGERLGGMPAPQHAVSRRTVQRHQPPWWRDPPPVAQHGRRWRGARGRSNKLPGWVVGVIDVALWDLLGKDTGLPVYTLMGGARRTTIPLYWSTGSGWRMQPEEMLALVRAGREQGFRSFKIRMDWRGWRQDVDPDKDFRIFKAGASSGRRRVLVRCQQRLLGVHGDPAGPAFRGTGH